MENFVSLIIIVLLIVFFETAAIALTKQYHLTSDIKYIILAIACYAIVCMLLSASFNYTSMGITNIIWSGLSVLAVALTGIVLFKEEFHVHDLFAAALITTGIVIFQQTN